MSLIISTEQFKILLSNFNLFKNISISNGSNHLLVVPEDDKDMIDLKKQAKVLLTAFSLLIDCMKRAIKQVEKTCNVIEIKIIQDICANRFSSTSAQCKYSTCEKTALAYRRRLVEDIYFKTITEIGRATGVKTEIVDKLVVPFSIPTNLSYNDIFNLYPVIKKNITYNYFNRNDEFFYDIFQEDIIEANIDFIKALETVTMIIKAIDPVTLANTPVYLGNARKRTFSPSQTSLRYKNLFKQKNELVNSLQILLWLYKQSDKLI